MLYKLDKELNINIVYFFQKFYDLGRWVFTPVIPPHSGRKFYVSGEIYHRQLWVERIMLVFAPDIFILFRKSAIDSAGQSHIRPRKNKIFLPFFNSYKHLERPRVWNELEGSWILQFTGTVFSCIFRMSSTSVDSLFLLYCCVCEVMFI